VSRPQYTFGDSDLAAERLALVAEAFAEPSRRLLERAVPIGVDVLDLGCGPGHSTRLIAEVCRPRRLVGVDSSESYIAMARREGGAEFVVHDVTALPLPGAPADAIYVRLLLAHLPDPLGLVERWRTQLRPGGVLVLDELNAMDPPPGPLRTYEDVVVEVVAAGGGAMYAGPLLASLGGRSVEHLVDSAAAARMYAMNMPSWRHRAVAGGIATDAELDELAAGLAAVAERPGESTVRWVLYQAVVEA